MGRLFGAVREAKISHLPNLLLFGMKIILGYSFKTQNTQEEPLTFPLNA